MSWSTSGPPPVVANGTTSKTKAPPLTIRCRLSRPTYLAGETVHGLLVLFSTVDQEMQESVTVRLHGHVKVDPRWLPDTTLAKNPQQPSRGHHASSSSGTFRLFGLGAPAPPPQPPASAANAAESLLPSFPEFQQENMACTLSTIPVTLNPTSMKKDQVTTYRFSVTLPSRMLPSYRGLGARFLYAVSISLGTKAYAHIPITILSNGYLGAQSPPSNYVAICMLEGRMIKSKVDPTGVDLIQMAGSQFCWRKFSLHNMENESEEIIPHRYEDEDDDAQQPGHDDTYLAGLSLERRAQRNHSTVYSVRNGQSHLGRFITYTREYQPGEPLDGAFDFTQASLRCYRINACLVREEYATAKRTLLQKTVVDAYQELTSSCESCSMFLKIPIDAVPSFQTAFISVEWKVYFEFLTSREGAAHASSAEASASQDGGAAQEAATYFGRVEQVNNTNTSKLNWVFPVKVVAPTDVDPTDLFLDHNVARCSADISL